MSRRLHEALEDIMACMTWHVSHMMHHVSWTMPVRITWRARVLPWEGGKDGTSMQGIMSEATLVQDLAGGE